MQDRSHSGDYATGGKLGVMNGTLIPYSEKGLEATLYFTSDLHLNHKNIMTYCPGRERFQDLDHMNTSIVNLLNEVLIDPSNTLFILGDVFMGPKDQFAGFYARLLNPQNIVLIAGNHDGPKALELFSNKCDEFYLHILRDGKPEIIWMNHFPVGASVDKRDLFRPKASEDYSIALCGHVHDKWQDNGECLNVGLDAWDFKVLSLGDVLEQATKRNLWRD